MKTLLLALLLTLQSTEPVSSQKVWIEQPEGESIALQVVQTNDLYTLLVEIKSPTGFIANPICDALLVVNDKQLVPKCVVNRSVEVISGRTFQHSVTEYLTISGSEKIKTALEANSVHVKIDRYQFDLNEKHLKQLIPTKQD